MAVLWSVKAKYVTYVAVTAVSLMILTTYTLFKTQGRGPYLPTISNTWEDPPGSYLSRWVVGTMTLPLALTSAIVYYDSPRKNADAALACVAVFSVWCFSWVGAVCDSPKPSCRGNDAVHSTFAVTFLALYTFYMVACCSRRRSIEGAVACLSLATKARFLRSGNSFQPVAILEWLDVALVMIWTALVVRHSTIRFGVVKGEEAVVGAAGVGAAAVACCLATLGSTYFLTSGATSVLSMWTEPPANWVARWGVVHGAQLAQVSHALLSFEDSRGSSLAIASLLALSLVGCVNLEENSRLSLAAASAWRLGYAAFYLRQQHRWIGVLTTLTGLATTCFDYQFCEWLDCACCLLGFAVLATTDRQRDLGLAFFTIDDDPQNKAPCTSIILPPAPHHANDLT